MRGRSRVLAKSMPGSPMPILKESVSSTTWNRRASRLQTDASFRAAFRYISGASGQPMNRTTEQVPLFPGSPAASVLTAFSEDSTSSTNESFAQRKEAHRAGLLIVNADDWGRDLYTTQRILDCTARGAVSSV